MSVTKIVRLKNGKKIISYRAEVYVRGIRLSDEAFETKTAAYNWHDAQKQKLTNSPKSAHIQEEKLSGCIEKYLEWSKARRRASSMQFYETRLPFFRESFLHKMYVRDISAEAVDLWLDWLIKHPTASNPGRKSFEKELILLTAILNWYRNYIDATYVVPITKRHREKCVYKFVPARRPDYFARPEEIKAWINWLGQHRNPVYAELATFMILTGCRVGEAAALMWDATDLPLKIARIVRTVHWDHWTRRPSIQEATKNEESNRVVVLSDFLVTMLEERRGETGGTGLVFQGKNGEALKYNAIQSAFNAGFKSLNLPWRSTHICRHTYATMALFATRDLTSVQASLGHRSREVTERYAKAVALLNSGTAEKTSAVFDLVVRQKNHAKNHAK